MAVCLCNGDKKDFSFTFRGSSCQGNFFGGAKKLHDLKHNFAVSNEIFRYIKKYLDRVNGSFTIAVCFVDQYIGFLDSKG